MRFILYFFLLLIFAFEYYSFRFPGMHRGSHRRRSWNNQQMNQARNMQLRASLLNQRGARLGAMGQQFQRMNGRKKRDLYETFRKVPGRD